MNGETGNEGTNVWLPKTLTFYLSVYYSDQVDWNVQLQKLRSRKMSVEQRRSQIAYTILAPVELGTRPTAPIEALLFVSSKFSGFEDRDWPKALEKVFEEDTTNNALRGDLLGLGSIHPVEYHARSRQALKWLCEQASNDPTITDEIKNDVVNRLKNLILIYGPSSVCSIFQRPELKAQLLPRVSNWRTGYFIERALTSYFSPEQLKEMKVRDMDKAPRELRKSFTSKHTESK